ncbi:MAG: hypothetical protein L3J91_00225 [Thermoplasmata archaeon]|nr:hypothetical protein [Thermoplasmata archaeon]
MSLTYPAAIEQFQEWADSPGLTMGNATAAATSLSFGPFAAGTIVAVIDGPLAVVSFAAAPGGLDLGHSTTISVTTAGGVGPFGYSFASLPPGCGGPGPTITCTPTQTGSYSVAVTVTDTYGLSSRATTTVDVNAAPSFSSFSASPSEVDIGMTASLAAAVHGGTVPFGFVYSTLPQGCTSADQAVLTCAPTATGTFNVGVQVTDADGETATSSITLTVDPAPTITFTEAGPVLLDVGMTTVLVAQGVGTGAVSYAWTGLPPGCTTVNSGTLTCRPGAPGAFTVAVGITDSIGGRAASSIAVEVAARPSSQVTASPPTIALGGTSWINVTVSGGTGPITYSFAGLPSGCTSSNLPSLACTPTSGGTDQITVTATDSLHQSGNTTVTLTVNGPPGNAPGGLNGLTAADTLAIVVGVLLGAAVLVLWFRQRRRKAA